VASDKVNSLFPSVGGSGGGGPLEGVWPENHKKIHNMQYRIQNTTHVHKLPIYLFFYIALGLNDMIVIRANP
jgi:hypothetical protein